MRENFRDCIVTSSRGGKTYKLFEKCLEQLIFKRNVLFLSPFYSNSKYTFNSFVEYLEKEEMMYSTVNCTRSIKLFNGAIIYFSTFENYTSGKIKESFRGTNITIDRLYKVADNIDMDAWYIGFNAISLTGKD